MAASQGRLKKIVNKRFKREQAKASKTLSPKTPVADFYEQCMDRIAKHVGHRCPNDKQRVDQMIDVMTLAVADQSDDRTVSVLHLAAAASALVIQAQAELEGHSDNCLPLMNPYADAGDDEAVDGRGSIL